MVNLYLVVTTKRTNIMREIESAGKSTGNYISAPAVYRIIKTRGKALILRIQYILSVDS
jgi:hypothetical protein